MPYSLESNIYKVDWPASSRVKAYFTGRSGGASEGIYDSFNLATHVGDKQESVADNRQQLANSLALAVQPFWLNQVHGCDCVKWQDSSEPVTADASYSESAYQICTIMTADCLPILFCDRDASWVAACHAGWRGLAAGVVENTLNTFSGELGKVIAWIGPAISQPHFEVGKEVEEIFLNLNVEYRQFFKQKSDQKFLFDFIGLAKFKLNKLGVDVYGGEYCSFSESDRFYSYRRDGETGRMASLIWLQD